MKSSRLRRGSGQYLDWWLHKPHLSKKKKKKNKNKNRENERKFLSNKDNSKNYYNKNKKNHNKGI